MRRLTRTIFAATLATALVLVAGCSGSDDAKETPNDSAQTLEKVTYLTSFGNFGRDSYVWVAKDKGFFKEVGIDVEIQAGKGSAANMDTLSSGRAQFVPADLSGFMLAKAGGKADNVVAIAGIQQRTLAALMTLDDKKITNPKDLEGKKLADSPSSTVRLLFPTYAQLAGVDASKVQWVNGQPNTLLNLLVAGQVDGIGQFVVGRATLESLAKGKKAVVLPYSDVMTDLYGNVLLTSTELIKEKPEMVKKFAQALLRGLEYSIVNPKEAGEILKKNVPATNADAAAAELELMAPYVRSAGSGAEIGTLDAQRVARNIAILQGAGAIPAGLTPEQVADLSVMSKA